MVGGEEVLVSDKRNNHLFITWDTRPGSISTVGKLFTLNTDKWQNAGSYKTYGVGWDGVGGEKGTTGRVLEDVLSELRAIACAVDGSVDAYRKWGCWSKTIKARTRRGSSQALIDREVSIVLAVGARWALAGLLVDVLVVSKGISCQKGNQEKAYSLHDGKVFSLQENWQNWQWSRKKKGTKL